MKIQEIYDEIVRQLSDNTSVRHGNGYSTWVISGRFYDSDGEKREVKATTHDEELATGWRSDPYDRNLYSEYQRKWAEFLADELELVNQY
jgi:hypothetical protein